jgi:hypothetical protein
MGGMMFATEEEVFSGDGTFAAVCAVMEKTASCAAAKTAAARQRA